MADQPWQEALKELPPRARALAQQAIDQADGKARRAQPSREAYGLLGQATTGRRPRSRGAPDEGMTESNRHSDEDGFEADVVKLAKANGWRVFSRPRTHAGRQVTTHAGWPDLVLWHPGRRIGLFIELKDRGRVSPEQANTLLELAECFGARCRVWTPNVWPEIRALLEGAS